MIRRILNLPHPRANIDLGSRHARNREVYGAQTRKVGHYGVVTRLLTSECFGRRISLIALIKGDLSCIGDSDAGYGLI